VSIKAVNFPPRIQQDASLQLQFYFDSHLFSLAMVRNILVGLMAVLPVLTEKCGVQIPEGTTFSKELLSGHGFAQPGTVPRADFPPPPKLDLFVHVVAGSEDSRDGYLTVTLPRPEIHELSRN